MLEKEQISHFLQFLQNWENRLKHHSTIILFQAFAMWQIYTRWIKSNIDIWDQWVRCDQGPYQPVSYSQAIYR